MSWLVDARSCDSCGYLRGKTIHFKQMRRDALKWILIPFFFSKIVWLFPKINVIWFFFPHFRNISPRRWFPKHIWCASFQQLINGKLKIHSCVYSMFYPEVFPFLSNLAFYTVLSVETSLEKWLKMSPISNRSLNPTEWSWLADARNCGLYQFPRERTFHFE